MAYPRPIALLFALLVLAACGDDQSPTTPTPPPGPGGPEFSLSPGHEVVNSLADPGNGVCNATECTLREAINEPGSTEISFAPGLTGSITLAKPSAGGGTLRIDKTITITGPSAGIAIQRRSTDPAFRILGIDEGVTVKLTNLTIRGGKTDLAGGGIVNFGTLALTNCTVASNASAQGSGGIDNHGPLTVRNSTVADNSGAGVYNRSLGTLTLTQSMVTRNTVGVVNSGGTLRITQSTVSDNSGGGIDTRWGTATLTQARIVANGSANVNSSGGGILAGQGAEVTLTNSTVARNVAGYGGGIANYRGSRFTIANSTVAGNSAANDGGGILNHGVLRAGVTMTLTNTTVSGNSAGSGGGIYTYGNDLVTGTLALTNTTVAFNSAASAGGGIAIASAGDITESGIHVTLRNSLVAKNNAPAGPDVVTQLPAGAEPTDITASFNLIGDGSGSGLANADGNLVGNVDPYTAPIDPRLGGLELNGGPTRTHALLTGSPAVDAAPTADCPATDQRGVLRPQGEACDIGSYERQ